MAKGFNETKGEAAKGGKYYKWVDGEQTLRLVGEVVARYVYWQKNKEGKNTSVECLSFDRDEEKFTNIEKDWFQHYFPDAKCSWAYVARAIDPTNPKETILIPMKKKLYAQIIDAAESLGDPTDVDTGWGCIITRTKTGSQAFNVEYALKALKCKNTPLTDEEREAVAKMAPIDSLVSRQTPDEQKKFVEAQFINSESNNDEAASEAEAEMDDLED